MPPPSPPEVVGNGPPAVTGIAVLPVTMQFSSVAAPAPPPLFRSEGGAGINAAAIAAGSRWKRPACGDGYRGVAGDDAIQQRRGSRAAAVFRRVAGERAIDQLNFISATAAGRRRVDR